MSASALALPVDGRTCGWEGCRLELFASSELDEARLDTPLELELVCSADRTGDKDRGTMGLWETEVGLEAWVQGGDSAFASICALV